ncbi:MAG: hypothetical protein GXO68_05650, partial [Crenarchaeota archaeon]|nr:hypothetical protein [Thermoproteota archaeon]
IEWWVDTYEKEYGAIIITVRKGDKTYKLKAVAYDLEPFGTYLEVKVMK